MARLNGSPVRQFRGTTAQHANYTGPSGELTVDTSKNAVVVQDGATKGGHPAAVDATVVHNTGDESISGQKIFNTRIIQIVDSPRTARSNIRGVVSGTLPSTLATSGFLVADETTLQGNKGSFGEFIVGYMVNGSTFAGISAFKADGSDAPDFACIQVTNPLSGDPYMSGPTPPADAASNEIVTAEWVKANNDYADLPLFFVFDSTGATEPVIHTVIPKGRTKATLQVLEASASASALTISVQPEYGSGAAIALPLNTEVDISSLAGKAVKFTIAGNTSQTSAAGLVHLV